MNNDINNSTEPKKSNRRYWTAGIIAVLGLTTVLGAQAYTGSRIARHVNIESAFSGEQGKVWNTGWRRSGSHFGSMSAEEREKQIVRMVKHLAVEIDATSEQQTKLVTLIKTVAEDMLPMRDKMHESRQQALKLLTAANIDRDAIEAMRLAKLAEVDTISKNLATAVADAADILTPEQRLTVIERIATFSKMRGHWKH